MTTFVRNFLLMIKILESLAMQLEGFNSVIKHQLSFNELIETKVTQLASSCLNHDTGNLSGQLEVTPKEIVSVVAVRARQSAQKPPLPQDASTQWKTVTARNTDAENGVLEEAEESNAIATQVEASVHPVIRRFSADRWSNGYKTWCLYIRLTPAI